MPGRARPARQRNKRGLWTCPNCARRFAKKNQSHSCDPHTVEHHLRRARPRVIQTYKLLISRLRKLGPVRIDAVKSSINLISKYHFGGVSVRENYLRIGFLAEEIIDDERIVRVEKVGPRRVEHKIVVRSPDDVDETVIGWLGNAYNLQC